MQNASEQYRGFTIFVQPIKGKDDLWDFEYRLTREGGSGGSGAQAPMTRSQTAGGHATAEVACLAGIEVGRTEVDNLLALAQAGAPKERTPDQ